MEIEGKQLGKKFGRHWVFRHVDVQISSEAVVAITGSNGSGKSTLLKILSGFLTPSEGVVEHDTIKVGIESANSFSYTAPYIELPEEMTFDEFLSFHSTFRPKLISNEEIAKQATLPLNKRIGEFSTGMKQRAQLSTAFYFENDALFMDEPTSNLDNEGFEWWKATIKNSNNLPIAIASNIAAEIKICKDVITL